MEVADARTEKPPDLVPPRRDDAPRQREDPAHVELPGPAPEAVREAELEPGDRPARPYDAGELVQRRARVVDVAEQVREREGVEGLVAERQPLRLALDQSDPRTEAGPRDALVRDGEHLGALVEADDGAARPAHELDRHRRRSGRDVEHRFAGGDVRSSDEKAAPARILAEREEAGIPVVGRWERCEEAARMPLAGGDGLQRRKSMLGAVSLSAELERIAAAAAEHADAAERVAAILATEAQPGVRVYLCAFERGKEARSWLALDAAGRPVRDRVTVREAVAIAALCEVAAETAGGGDLEELRGQLVELRVREDPPGIEEAEEAALAVERAVGAPPRLATPAYLDDVGAATRRLEQALGDGGSPFATAMRGAFTVVDALQAEVERSYKTSLG